MRRLAGCSLTALCLLAACAAEEQQQLAPGSASCSELADHEIELCPAYAGERSDNIEICESSRLDDELIGCDEPYARFVLCLTEATDYDCEQGPEECYAQLDLRNACRQRFVQRTGCTRVPRDDVCAGQPQPYSFNCIGDGPAGCGPPNYEESEAQQIFNVGFRCCPAFASKGVSYFSDPELSPGE